MGKWKIWADTGGTFTDCIATSPTNEVKRIKILSSSILRGKVEEVKTKNHFTAKVNWFTEQNIFSGYILIFSDYPESQFEIESTHPKKEEITLKKAPEFQIMSDMQFSVTAFEEAPVMAARIATETELSKALPPMFMRLGSTKGTNALLERKGAKTALITTAGFKDIIRIGDQTRKNIFSLKVENNTPLHDKVIEVDERLNANGQVLNPLSQDEIAPVVNEIKEAGIDTVAVSLMHSYLNDIHEQKLKQYLQAFGIKHVSASAELEPNIDFLARTATTLINAYLAPIIEEYINKIADKIPDTDLRIMTSAGGLNGAHFFKPKDSLLSGPAGGVVGAAAIAKTLGQEKIITLDMGGTSTDVSRFAGEYDYQYETEIDGNRLMAPSLSIKTVAAGGGSICQYDGYKFSAGPESAGAFPGPACYGNKGPLTITDVNLLLGRIDASTFGIPLKKSASENALEILLDQKYYQQKETILSGFLQIANEKMAEAIRKISISKGYDPTEYALLGFGGAGGQHVCSVAQILNIQKIIVPYDAGLLSAYGMGQAKIERFASKEVLKSYSDATNLDDIIQHLSDDAFSQLEKEGFEKNQVEVRKVYLYLRYLGQNYSLEISYDNTVDPIAVFYDKYEQLYGYLPEEGIIELVTIKVIVSSIGEDIETNNEPLENYIPKKNHEIDCYFENQWQSTPVYKWESLSYGASISGPALLVSENSTIVVEPHWHLSLNKKNNAVLEFNEIKTEDATNNNYSNNEAISLELFTNRFTAVAEEMGALLQRTALSVNIKERLDFSCALLDKNGYLVVNAPHIPVHLGSMGLCVRKTIKAININEGDVIITNHPSYGGSHLPDVTLIAGVFDNKNTLIGYVANRAHHAEIGGIAPGSFPVKASNLEEEGVVIPPTYIVKGNKVQWENIKQLFTKCKYPSRSIKENLADLNAALASIAAGKQALLTLSENYSTKAIMHYMAELNHYTAVLMNERLQTLKGQQFEAMEYLDDKSVIQVKISQLNDKWKVDFSGTSAVHPKNLNATEAITNSVLIYILRLLLDKDVPLNEGLMRPISVVLPECILNPNYPDNPALSPAVAGGNTETSQRLTDTLLKAFGLAACSQGTMNNLLFGNESFGYYETIGGGVGAGENFHGASAVHQHMTNTRITDAEVMERRYPVRVEKFGIRENSGGLGKFNGGDGIERRISFLTSVELTLLSQHREERPYGIAGGDSGQVGRQYVTYSNGSQENILGISTLNLKSGDTLTILTPGGGGYGEKN